MAFGDDFLKGFFGSDYLKDFTHASKTFRSNGYELAPRQKFLFHVYFNINTIQIPQLASVFDTSDRTEIGLLVKNVQLPRFTFDTETLNQYNRKRIVQKKIEYDPVNVVFHDDGSDLVRNLWYNYFSYYYKDPTQSYWSPSVTNGTLGETGTGTQQYNYNSRDIYSDDRSVNDWGYIGESYSDSTQNGFGTSGKPPFFRDITVYGFNQHRFVAYVLINPLIENWQHDTYDYSAGDGIMENTMQIRYETVKYYDGALSGETPDANVPGFADPARYDTVDSPLARPGSTASIIGQGGLLDTAGGIVRDLQSGSVAGVIGAIQKGGRAYETFGDRDIGEILQQEGEEVLRDVIRQGTPAVTNAAINAADGFFFPKKPDDSNLNTAAPSTPRPVDGEDTP
mgnify:CR=1 FL=1